MNPEDREDRFGDLGREEPSAAERFAELDEGDMEAERRERERQAAGPPRPGGRYTWVVGVAALIVIIVVGVNSLSNPGRGTRGPPEGERIPVFAAPLLESDLEGDTNIKQDRNDDNSDNDTPACHVTGEDVFNVCELFAEKPLVLVLAASSDECEDELVAAERLSGSMPELQFAATITGRSRDQAREFVAEAGIAFPVGWDEPPPVLFNLYRVAFCSTAFVARGGVLREFEANSPLSEDELRAGAERLLPR
jgi:hypothetical protein